ncbi:MAG: hypothetical protein DI564_14075 [Rhodanobacter denitrificans]|uniref:Uncharacterized protein n=1 Tax=Rhodanobacter denitrificans TaxID=666685 RepID=A0A2W5M3V1_9GAMM|nr:MAG: hypothetical protein DI564_14075 [Rhodanobacter denitrificans]
MAGTRGGTAFRDFVAELQRRNVIRAAALYTAAAWLLVQVATQVFPFFNIPNWVVRWIVVAALIGFPIWLVLAWMYELSPEGLRRESEDPRAERPERDARRMNAWIVGIACLAVAVLVSGLLVDRRGSEVAPAPTPTAIPEKSIAVLPLRNESGDLQDRYFSDGLSEDLTTELARFGGLKVISRDSAFRFRDSTADSATIGAQLGVATLLQGSVRRQGDALRISATLVRAADGSVIWSERFDRPYKELFATQDEIAHAVASSLKAKWLPGDGAAAQGDRPPSGNLDAYQAFLRGAADFRSGDPARARKAVDEFAEAIRIDPAYAAAYAGTAIAWSVIKAGATDAKSIADAAAHAREASARALALNADLALAHMVRATVLFNVDANLAEAVEAARRAYELAPHDGRVLATLATVTAAQGDAERAVQYAREATVLDPLAPQRYETLGDDLALLGSFDEAEAAYRKAEALSPNRYRYYNFLTQLAVLRGDAKKALEYAEREKSEPWDVISRAYALQIGTDRAAADAAIEAVERACDGTCPAIVAALYALRGDADRAFEWMYKQIDVDRGDGMGILSDPILSRLRSDPRYADFAKKLSQGA